MSLMKLFYFPMAGRAEMIRLIFAAGKKQFEDVRIPRSEWPSLKPTMPLGQMPVLEVDGVKYPQTLAIARYVARECGLYGSSNIDALKIDAVVDTCSEMIEAYIDMKFRFSEDEKKTHMPSFINEVIPRTLHNLSKLLKLYGSNDFFVGGKLTLADIFVYQFIEDMKFFKPNLLENHSDLAANCKRVKENEGIKKYLKESCSSQF